MVSLKLTVGVKLALMTPVCTDLLDKWIDTIPSAQRLLQMVSAVM